MTTKTNILATGTALALVLMASTAISAELPKPCGPDPRTRCVAFDPSQIISLPLVPGATATIQLPDNEVVFSIGTSDNDIISGKPAAERVAVGQSSTSDPNLQVSVPGNDSNPTKFLLIKALRHLEPQPFVVIGIWTNSVTGKQEYRRHTFELSTQPGGPQAPDAFFSVHFSSDPIAEKIQREADRKERQKIWQEKQAKIEAQAVADRLTQVQQSVLARNTAYDGQSTDADRAALAPTAPTGLDAMWDDGQRTYLRYPGNRPVPLAYQVMPDGSESVIGQSTVVDSATKGSLLIIHSVVPMLRLRDGNSILCITNKAYDPVGHRTGTGTVDPGIVREVRGTL
jgi:type IV secretion system protein VirB9